MALFNNQVDNTQNWKYLYFNLKGSIFHKLELRNTWIYTVNTENVVLTCGSEEKTENVLLCGTGLLTLDEQCKGYANQNILHPITTVISEKIVDFIPETKLLKGEQIDHITLSKLPNLSYTGQIEKLHELKSISSSIDDINRDIDYNSTKQSIQQVYTYNHYVIFSIIILFIFIVICSKIKTICSQPPPVPVRDYGNMHFDTITKVTEV